MKILCLPGGYGLVGDIRQLRGYSAGGATELTLSDGQNDPEICQSKIRDTVLISKPQWYRPVAVGAPWCQSVRLAAVRRRRL